MDGCENGIYVLWRRSEEKEREQRERVLKVIDDDVVGCYKVMCFSKTNKVMIRKRMVLKKEKRSERGGDRELTFHTKQLFSIRNKKREERLRFK